MWTGSDQQMSVRNQNLYLDYLDKVSESFLLSVEMEQYFPVGVKEFCEDVKNWLATLAPEETSTRVFSSPEYGFVGSITAHPRGKIQIHGAVFEWRIKSNQVSDTSLACSRAMGKVMKFRTAWSGPLVLAVCSRDNATFDMVEACARLLGRINVSGAKVSRQAQLRIEVEGFNSSLANRPWISAVLFCNRRLTRTGFTYEKVVLHNPFADSVVQPSVFADLGQLYPKREAKRLFMTYLKPEAETISFI